MIDFRQIYKKSRKFKSHYEASKYLGLASKAQVIKAHYLGRLLGEAKGGGAIVECGVGAGNGLAVLLSLISRDTKYQNQKIWAFDSFEGFPDAGERDRQLGPIKPVYKKYDIAYVKNYLLKFGLEEREIDSKIVFAKGWIPESFTQYDGGPVSFLSLDVDLYQSYMDSLEFWYDLVLPGGIIAFDEYKNTDEIKKWPGGYLAIDEFLAEKKKYIMQDELSNKYYLIKPE